MPTTNGKPYILNRTLDLWVTGLFSILVISLLLLVDPAQVESAKLGDVLVLATVINGAHFMASYRMLYYSKEHAMRYPQASIYMPLALGAYCFVAVWQAKSNPIFVSAILIVTSIYLALHYTGQTWGMMSSLAYVDGVKFSAKQRTAFKTSLKLLMIWQIIWALSILDPKPLWLQQALSYLGFVQYFLIAGAAILGVYGIIPLLKEFQISRMRVLVPYIAIYFWYALLTVNKFALPLIQFFHAIQYLIFPLRVELNRHNLSGMEAEKSAKKHLFEYLIVMLVLGALAFVLVPIYLKSIDPLYAAAIQVFIAAINIHHFYIDGYIWKISQPVVKDELFAHLKHH